METNITQRRPGRVGRRAQRECEQAKSPRRKPGTRGTHADISPSSEFLLGGEETLLYGPFGRLNGLRIGALH